MAWIVWIGGILEVLLDLRRMGAVPVVVLSRQARVDQCLDTREWIHEMNRLWCIWGLGWHDFGDWVPVIGMHN